MLFPHVEIQSVCALADIDHLAPQITICSVMHRVAKTQDGLDRNSLQTAFWCVFFGSASWSCQFTALHLTAAMLISQLRPMSFNTQDSFQATLKRLSSHGWDKKVAGVFLDLWRSDTANMRYGLMAGAGLLKTGRAPDGVALLSMLADQNPIIRTAQYQSSIDAPLKEASRNADIAIRRAFTELQSKAIERCGTENAGRIATAIWPQTHFGSPPFPQNAAAAGFLGPKPYMFYAADLPNIPVFDTAPWTKNLSAQTDIIRDEFITLMHDDTLGACLLYTSPSPRDRQKSRMPSSA